LAVAVINAEALGELLQVGTLGWTGALRGDGLLVRLGAPLLPLHADRDSLVDLCDQASIDRAYGPTIATWDSHDLSPSGLILCQSHERIRLGPDLSGWMSTLSHLARVGLMVHLASSAIMPGFDGHLTLELYNAAPTRLRLHYGMPAAKVLIEHVTGPARSAAQSSPFYGPAGDLASRYAEEFGDDLGGISGL
jgi:deoxycytidine triphosphate deaminase